MSEQNQALPQAPAGSVSEESETKDGQTASPSSLSLLSPDQRAAAELADEVKKLSRQYVMTPDQRTLTLLGITKRKAIKLIRATAGDPREFINTRVTATCNTVDLCNSVDVLAQAQRHALKLGKSKDVQARERVASLSVVAQLGVAIVRTCEANLATAKSIDRGDKDDSEEKPPTIGKADAVFFGFPPVAPNPGRSIPTTAISGEQSEG